MRAAYVRCFTEKWQGRAEKAPARVNPNSKKSPIWSIITTVVI